MIFDTATAFLIEQSITELGVDAALCRGDKDGQWTLTYKGSTVYIDLFSFPEKPNQFYFQVMSPLMKVPDRNKEAIYLNLLTINFELYGCSICVKGEWMYMMSLREADNLDKSEIDATIDRIAFYSADYYSKLLFKYEGSWDSKPTDSMPNNN
ncbi:MAG: YbjN domain-containing protein [Brumimicrobium sp.]|nr:YbjN domain-containing protein [Brumimicrobium sp.]